MTHNLPIPAAAAVAGDWYAFDGCAHPDDVSRVLTWPHHDVCTVHVAVDGAQYSDGRVKRHITLYPYNGDVALTAAGARQLAGALLNAPTPSTHCGERPHHQRRLDRRPLTR